MATFSTKDQTIILLALLIIYIGVYTLRSPDVPVARAADAQWAGFFSITLGVFALLTMLFGQSISSNLSGTFRSASGFNVFSIVALGSLLASAFFNFKLVRAVPKGSTLQYLLFAQIAAHVLLIFTYFFSINKVGDKADAFRAGTAYGAGVASNGSTMMGMSPRVPVRAR